MRSSQLGMCYGWVRGRVTMLPHSTTGGDWPAITTPLSAERQPWLHRHPPRRQLYSIIPLLHPQEYMASEALVRIIYYFYPLYNPISFATVVAYVGSRSKCSTRLVWGIYSGYRTHARHSLRLSPSPDRMNGHTTEDLEHRKRTENSKPLNLRNFAASSRKIQKRLCANTRMTRMLCTGAGVTGGCSCQ